MKLYVKTQGKTVGPLDWDRILTLHANGRLSIDATVSEDKTTWLTIEQVKQLTGQGSEKSDKSNSLSTAGDPSLTTSGLRLRKEEDQQPNYMPQQPNMPQLEQPGYNMPLQQPSVTQPQQSGYYMLPQQPNMQQPQQMGNIPQQPGIPQPQQAVAKQIPTGQQMMNQYQIPPATGNVDIPSHMAEAIIVTLLCCLPFGIVAIVKASQVSGHVASGNIQAARAASNEAKKYVNIAIISGLIINALWVLIAIIGEA